MKPQNILTTLGTLLVSALIAHAQDAATPAPAAAAPETSTPAIAPATAAPAIQVADAATAPPAAAEPAAVAPATDANPVVAAEAQPAAESPQTNAVMKLIVFDDTPLLDAIRNMARQAGINIMIDPKVAYGQPDPAKPGAVVAQPSVSIRWENITPEQALNALLNNYGLQAVEDPKVKITRVTTKDPAAPDPLVTRTFQLSYASPLTITNALFSSLSDKRSRVVADVRTSQIVIVATEKELVETEKLVVRLDTKTKQVLIEAKILETTVNPKTTRGVDWTGTLEKQHLNFGNNLKANVSTESLNDTLATTAPKMLFDTAKGFNPGTAFLDADGLSATLSFLNTHNDTKVVSEPRMVTLDNQKATIDVGLLFPVVQTSAGTANTSGGSQISYTNLTVSLEVTPRIAANDQVELKVSQGVTRLGPVFLSTVGSQNNAVNSFFTRQANTTVLIPSAHTLVLGGLISDENTSDNVKVPLLGDIPVLGLLFRKDSKERNRNNLIIFITPTIVGDDDFQAAATTFLKTKPENTEDPAWSAWDSGKPRDWSKKGVPGGATK